MKCVVVSRYNDFFMSMMTVMSPVGTPRVHIDVVVIPGDDDLLMTVAMVRITSEVNLFVVSRNDNLVLTMGVSGLNTLFELDAPVVVVMMAVVTVVRLSLFNCAIVMMVMVVVVVRMRLALLD
ncbi:hypothetical protein BV25DRAFT_1173193 [Artomyces pyxidatus]|uniref:Uncharacterized protein n=1 Tax=Artomyces pyxidatus TaxID=48021 RepID=A0ACB8ST13_9AGAM|nr:hypothetical protein BV25DRAFT_1173193 [Artomyces pyxidatus]